MKTPCKIFSLRDSAGVTGYSEYYGRDSDVVSVACSHVFELLLPEGSLEISTGPRTSS